jgi:hypothetical protein
MMRILIIFGLGAIVLALRNRSPESALRIGVAVALFVVAGNILGSVHRIAGLALAAAALAVGLVLSSRNALTLTPRPAATPNEPTTPATNPALATRPQQLAPITPQLLAAALHNTWKRSRRPAGDTTP